MTKAFATMVAFALWVNLGANLALAGALDPDFTAETAAKDSAKRATGMEDEGPLDKDVHDDEGFIKKAVK